MLKKKLISDGMKNVAKISSGTVLGQLISIATLPIITRIYGADIIGVWTTIYAISIILVTIYDLGLSQTLMICDKDEVKGIYSLINVLSILVGAVASVVIFMYYSVLLGYSVNNAFVIAFFVFVYSFFFRMVETTYICLNREKKYSVLMKNPVINYGTGAIIAIILGLVGFKSNGYFIAMTIGQVLTFLHMKKYAQRISYKISLTYYKSLIRKYSEFVKFQMPTSIFSHIRMQLPNLIIGSLFGQTILGMYAISQKLLNIPVTFVGQALGKVFYQRIAEMKREGKEIGQFVIKTINKAIIIGILPMIALVAFGDVAVVLFFGYDYGVGGVICRIVAFGTFFTFLASATQGLDIVTRKQKIFMISCIAQTVLAVVGIYISYYFGQNIYNCAFLITITFIIVQVVYYCVILKAINHSYSKYLFNVATSFIIIIIGSLLIRQAVVWVCDVTQWSFFIWIRNQMQNF